MTFLLSSEDITALEMIQKSEKLRQKKKKNRKSNLKINNARNTLVNNFAIN